MKGKFPDARAGGHCVKQCELPDKQEHLHCQADDLHQISHSRVSL